MWCVDSVVCLKASVEIKEFECVGDSAGLVDGKEKVVWTQSKPPLQLS